MTTQVKQDLQHLESGQIPGAGRCGTGQSMRLSACPPGAGLGWAGAEPWSAACYSGTHLELHVARATVQAVQKVL